jgi:hypothetical protein
MREYWSEGAQRAPGDVLVDEVNLKLTILPVSSPAESRAALRGGARLFLQRRERMNALDKADQAAAKGLPENLARENRCA